MTGLSSTEKAVLIIFIVIISYEFLAFYYIISNWDKYHNHFDDEGTKETIAEKDTYVELADKAANNGGKGQLIVGEFVNATESFLYFEFEDEPYDWEEVEIELNIYNVTERMEVEIYLTSDYWNEFTMNWTNRPIKKSLIDKFEVETEKKYKIDVTDEVEHGLGIDDNGISICIHHSNNASSKGYFQALSSEGCIDESDAPLLIWTYKIAADRTIMETPEFLNILIIIQVIVGIVGASLMIWLLYERFIKKKSFHSKENIPAEEEKMKNKKNHLNNTN